MSLTKSGAHQGTGATVEALESRQLLSASAPSAHANLFVIPASSGGTLDGFTPAQIRHAYGFDQVSGDGAGQTIAIVDAFRHPNIVADLNTFDQKYGIAAPPSFRVVGQGGGSVAGLRMNTGWASEVALDVEWAHAIAPGASILLVETKSDNFPDLMAGVNYARTVPGVSVVSMSWGGSEFRGQLKYDGSFTTPSNHQGITFVAASGDDGTRHGAEWPASSSHVVGVGGTTLTAGSDGSYVSESVWEATSGGVSHWEIKPSYQMGVQSGARRSTPDVAYNADPNTGFSVYSSVRDQGVVGWQELGGTSAGTPQWAAQVAIANQLRAAGGQNTLDSGSGTLPSLYHLYRAPGSASIATYSSSLHDIVQGHSGRVFASAGYDNVTGIGSPKAAEVIAALASAASTPAVGMNAVSKTANAAVARRKVRRPTPQVERPGSTGATPAVLYVPPSNRSTSIAAASESARSTANTAAANAAASSVRAMANLPFAAMRVAPAVYSSWTYASPDSLGSVLFSRGELLEPTLAGAVTTVTAAVNTVAASGQAMETVLPMAMDVAGRDAMVAFADSLASFAHESAALGTVVAASHARAWAVTIGVACVDAILIGYWRATRNAKRAESKGKASPFSMLPI